MLLGGRRFRYGDDRVLKGESLIDDQRGEVQGVRRTDLPLQRAGDEVLTLLRGLCGDVHNGSPGRGGGCLEACLTHLGRLVTGFRPGPEATGARPGGLGPGLQEEGPRSSLCREEGRDVSEVVPEDD